MNDSDDYIQNEKIQGRCKVFLKILRIARRGTRALIEKWN